jgi:prepilin signal peptidase PulO-like enzyme (type II secretory pathway)
MAFHLSSVPGLRFPGLAISAHGWVPDWPALAAGLLGAGLGVVVAFAIDRFAALLLPEPAARASFDGFGGDFVSGMWMGGFDQREPSSFPHWANMVVLALAGGISTGGSLHRYGVHASGAFAALFCFALLVIVTITFQKKQLPEVLVLLLLWIGLLISVHVPFVTAQSAIVGAIAGYSIPWILCLPTRFLGRAVFSDGDYKLYAAAGAWLGLAAMPQVLSVSLILSAVGVFFARLSGRFPEEGYKGSGPYIAIAAGVTMLCGVWLNIPYVTALGVL